MCPDALRKVNKPSCWRVGSSTHTHTQKKRREKIKKQLKKNEPIKRITFYFFSKADAILRALSCRSSSFVLVVFVCFFLWNSVRLLFFIFNDGKVWRGCGVGFRQAETSGFLRYPSTRWDRVFFSHWHGNCATFGMVDRVLPSFLPLNFTFHRVILLWNGKSLIGSGFYRL